MRQVTGDPFTADHLQADFEFHADDAGVGVRYGVRVYPGIAGVRTRLALRALRPFAPLELPSYIGGSYAESLPLDAAACRRLAAGYYNDPQHRNRDDTPILRQETHDGPLAGAGGRREIYDWCNLLTLERDGAGLTLVKESNKCVNQAGFDGGAFVLDERGVRVTGLGMTPYLHGTAGGPWLTEDRYRAAWATWTLLHPAGESHRQLAVKRFDRARFNPDPTRLVRSRANTWGSREPGPDARDAAAENNVLREIDACADLHLDAVAVDEGWQTPADGKHPADTDWRPHPDRYPDGWRPVVDAAERGGVQLDLWIAAFADLQHMTRNASEGGFDCFKLDWYSTPNRDAFEVLLDKVHALIKQTGNRLRVSWDVTENSPRLGYFTGREYGSLHPSNRHASSPQARSRHVVYHPRLVLRDAWHYAHYLNLNQIEFPIQNVDRITPADGNASEHPHDSTVALTLMGVPLFFQEVQLYDAAARSLIRPVMQTWREHRDAMARGYVFPLGDEPCDAAWCGFQSHDPASGTGYITVFRELHAPDAERAMPLHLIAPGTTLRLHDVMNGDVQCVTTDDAGAVPIRIDQPAGYRWLRYKALA